MLKTLVSYALVLTALLSGRSLSGQSAESANAGGVAVWVGASVSGYYLQYGGEKNLGLSGFFDADSIRRWGVEGEGRWLDYHETANVHAETYLAGPRYHVNIGRFQPYVKGLAGLGSFNFPYNYAHGRYFVVAPGGGADYFLTHRLTVRADFEYQIWPQFTFGSMSSVGASAGIRYRILK
ncbi:MAG TPA: hypothetical protein VGG85_12665 [Terracidiphilus sp.]